MSSALLELLPLLVELLVFSAGTAALSVASLLFERFAFGALQSGDTTIAVWAAVLGAVALGFAYLLATDKVVPRVAAVRAGDDAA